MAFARHQHESAKGIHVFCHPELPSHLSPHSISLGFPECWLWVPFFVHRTCTGHLENDDFSVENLPDKHCLIQVVTVSATSEVRMIVCTLDRMLWKWHFSSVVWFPQTQNMNVVWEKKNQKNPNWQMYSSAWAALTKFHKLGSWNNRNWFLMFWKLESELGVPAWPGSGKAVFSVCRRRLHAVSSHSGESSAVSFPFYGVSALLD